MKSRLRLRGRAEITVRIPGEEPRKILARNKVMNLGKNRIAGIVATNDGTYDTITAIALGDSGNAVDEDQTALEGTEHTRAAGTVTAVGREVKISHTFSHSGATVTVREIGIFDNVTPPGLMFARFLIPATSLPDGSDIQIDWFVEFEGAEE